MSQDRRRFPRISEVCDARCRRAGWPGEPWELVRTINVSATGMRFVSRQAFEQGAALELQLKLPLNRGVKEFSVHGTVVWSHSLAAGVTEVGVQFDNLTTDQRAEIDDFVTFLLEHSRHKHPDG